MSAQQAEGWTRRRFLGGLTVAGAAGLLGLSTRPVAAEPPPETTRLRLHKTSGICVAPQYVAEELLRAEGFREVHYVEMDSIAAAKIGSGMYQQLAAGALDMGMAFVTPFIVQVDAGVPIVLLGGVHVGCYEVFGTDRVRAIRDLKGKTVAVPELGGSHQLFVASMAQYAALSYEMDRQVEGTVEADELYHTAGTKGQTHQGGTKPLGRRPRRRRKKREPGRGHYDKDRPAIVAWVSRQGPVVVQAVKDITVATVQKAAGLAVQAGSRLYTDSASSYRALQGYRGHVLI
jgi:hypothetical protein